MFVVFRVWHTDWSFNKNCWSVSILRIDHTGPRVLFVSYMTSCARGDTICPRPSPLPVGALAPRAPPSRRNVAVLSHTEYVPTLTAAAAVRVKAALSKAAMVTLT